MKRTSVTLGEALGRVFLGFSRRNFFLKPSSASASQRHAGCSCILERNRNRGHSPAGWLSMERPTSWESLQSQDCRSPDFSPGLTQWGLHSWLPSHACPRRASSSSMVFLHRSGHQGSHHVHPVSGARPMNTSSLAVDQGWGNLEGDACGCQREHHSAGQALSLMGWPPGVPYLGPMAGHAVILLSPRHVPLWSVLLISVPGGWQKK